MSRPLDMKKYSISCFLLLASILMLSEHSDARKDLEGVYWKQVMKDQPMPKAITDILFHEDHEEVPSILAGSTEKDHFVPYFRPTPNAIIYHSVHHTRHPHHPEEKKHDMEPKEEIASYVKTVNHG